MANFNCIWCLLSVVGKKRNGKHHWKNTAQQVLLKWSHLEALECDPRLKSMNYHVQYNRLHQKEVLLLTFIWLVTLTKWFYWPSTQNYNHLVQRNKQHRKVVLLTSFHLTWLSHFRIWLNVSIAVSSLSLATRRQDAIPDTSILVQRHWKVVFK